MERYYIMELYQRVKRISKELAGSETKMATLLGIQQRTFNGYLSPDRQDNLLALLPRILQEYPQISREWLYFDEGDMYGGGGPQKPPTPHIDAALLQQVMEMLEEHLQAVKGKLSPARKAAVVSQLYELIVEQEEQAREPIQMMRLVMGALAKAANG